MELEQLRQAVAQTLNDGGMTAMVSWPDGRRKALKGPVVLVSLQGLSCSPAGMQDYLGLRQDPDSGAWEELYGRRAEVIFGLEVAAPSAGGAAECRGTFERLVQVLQQARPGGLTVRQLTGGEVEYDEKEGLLVLRVELRCSGWLYAAGDEGGSFLDFVLKGDVKV